MIILIDEPSCLPMNCLFLQTIRKGSLILDIYQQCTQISDYILLWLILPSFIFQKDFSFKSKSIVISKYMVVLCLHHKRQPTSQEAEWKPKGWIISSKSWEKVSTDLYLHIQLNCFSLTRTFSDKQKLQEFAIRKT